MSNELKQSHKYLLDNPEPRVTEMTVEQAVTVGPEYFEKATKDQLINLFLHTAQQDAALIEELNIEVKRARNEAAYYRKLSQRNASVAQLDKLKYENSELKDKLKWVKESVREFLNGLKN